MHRFLFPPCLALLCLLLAAGHAHAHRVTIFAYVDGADIVTECGFSRGARVRQGLVEVFDAATGAKVLEGRTDNDGVFRFPAPGDDIIKGHGLRIRINAGEGHQNDWIMDPAELEGAVSGLTARASVPSGGLPGAGPEVRPDTEADTGADAAVPPAAMTTDAPAGLPPVPARGNWATPEDVERIVDAALNARLEPIRHLLARQSEDRPSVADIIGGIGWILGLAGVAAYFRRRR